MTTNNSSELKVISAVTSSRLYQSSSKQAHILAAIRNPVNKELVRQIGDYIDGFNPELEESDQLGVDVPEAGAPAAEDDIVVDTKSDADSDADTLQDDKPAADTEDTEGSSDVSEDQEQNEDESAEDSVAESTSVVKSAVLGSEIINSEYSDPRALMFTNVAAIRGTLNLRQDTCGVRDVRMIDNELWIYYNEDINLSAVMGPAISVLYTAEFYNLEFNRLSRADNAMVFLVLGANT